MRARSDAGYLAVSAGRLIRRSATAGRIVPTVHEEGPERSTFGIALGPAVAGCREAFAEELPHHRAYVLAASVVAAVAVGAALEPTWRAAGADPAGVFRLS